MKQNIAVVGAGFNYWLMGSTLTAAYMIFRKMHLERRQAAEPARPAGNPAIAAVKRRLRLLRGR